MKELGSKNEVRDQNDQHKKETEEKLDEAREHHERLETAVQVLDRMPPPTLSETAEGLNNEADRMQQDATENTDNHEHEVEEGVENERKEVSEPVREGEDVERGAVEDLRQGGADAIEYKDHIDSASDVREETADFLQEVAEDSEDHQDNSSRDNAELTRIAKAAADAIRRF